MNYIFSYPWSGFGSVMAIDNGSNVETFHINTISIENYGSTILIIGAKEITPISVYDTSGKMIGFANTVSDNTEISTSLHPGEICIIKINGKTIKYIMK